jgi:hypothetical protein
MNERERGRLLSKIKLLENELETELEQLRRRQRGLGDSNPGCPVCEEVAFLADYLDRFTIGAIEWAKEVSRSPMALEVVRARCLELHARFNRYLGNQDEKRLMLGSMADPGEKDRVHRRFESAVRTSIMRLEDAEFDFHEVPLGKRQQPPVHVIDQWIKSCSATNCKEAWRQISAQRDFPRPLWKIFYARWIQLRPAKRGRPRKRVN